jgi:hypothetical protein
VVPGGAGLGRGGYNDATSSLALPNSVVTLSEADGVPGGGVYTLGAFSDPLTLIISNHASTSGDDIGPERDKMASPAAATARRSERREKDRERPGTRRRP